MKNTLDAVKNNIKKQTPNPMYWAMLSIKKRAFISIELNTMKTL
jgi:hypothetical protein